MNSTFSLVSNKKLNKKRVEKIIYSKKFEVIADELYKPFSDGKKNKILRYSKTRTEAENIFWAKIYEIDNYFFFSLDDGREKFFQILDVTSHQVILFAPNNKSN